VYYESFESGIPDYFTATRPDSLSISPWHYKQGAGSLQWDWHAGEELLIRHAIGDVDRVGGYRCKAAFSVWLYVEEPLADALVFEFIEGQTVTGSFRFPLQFTAPTTARSRRGNPRARWTPSASPHPPESTREPSSSTSSSTTH